MKHVPGTVSISHIQQSKGDDFVRITISDDRAGVEIAHIDLSHEAFGRLLGSRVIHGAASYNDSGNVGKVREHKQERVQVDYTGCTCREERDAAAQAAAAPFEVDGWRAMWRDAQNPHRHVMGGNGNECLVRFYRWVDAEPHTKEATPNAD